MGRTRNITAAFVALVALGVSACGAGNDETATVDQAPIDQTVREAPAGDEADGVSPDADSNTLTELSTGGSGAPSAPLGLDEIGRSIAVEAGVTIATSDIRQAVDDTLTTVRQRNANVFDADVNIGDEYDDGTVGGNARIVVKVQPTELDGLIADLDGTAGTLIGRTQTSEDVTNQLVDLDIRVRVERETIERFENLLTESADLDELVSLQRVITEHTVTLEQLLASQRNTEQRVDLSTLTIDLQYVTPTTAVAEAPADDGIVDGLRSGWDVFAGVLFTIALALAIGAPFLLAAGLVGIVVWLVTRRRRSHVAAAMQPLTAPPSSPTVGSEHEVTDGAVGEGEGRPHAGVGDHR